MIQMEYSSELSLRNVIVRDDSTLRVETENPRLFSFIVRAGNISSKSTLDMSGIWNVDVKTNLTVLGSIRY